LELELWKPQWNIAFLIQLWQQANFFNWSHFPGRDLRESRSQIQFKAEAVRFAHDLLRFELCESQWLTFQNEISAIKKTHRLAPKLTIFGES
jgi:hypothetical protein